MTMIDTMAADAVKRLDLWLSRSCGQHKRALHHAGRYYTPRPLVAAIALMSGETIVDPAIGAALLIDFAGAEPDEPNGLAMFGRGLGALIGLALLAALATYFYIKLNGV